jgi:hypothetical protein
VITTGAEIMDEVFGLEVDLRTGREVRLLAAQPGYDGVD